MEVGMTIRAYRSSDLDEILTLFYDTVHTVNAKDYTSAQLDAWADGRADREAWNRSFLAHHTLVALIGGRIAGFADMDPTSGYLDRLYVHRDDQGKGVATALCDRLERENPSETYTVHASITARPFFEKRGYAVVCKQEVQRHGVWLVNYAMEKRCTVGEKEPGEKEGDSNGGPAAGK